MFLGPTIPLGRLWPSDDDDDLVDDLQDDAYNGDYDNDLDVDIDLKSIMRQYVAVARGCIGR